MVSRDALNQVPGWRFVNVVPLSTSERQARRGPTTLTLSRGTGGLTQDSVALCHQITSLGRGKLVGLIGTLELVHLDQALRIAPELD